jgi:hypothetical protein
MSSQFKARPKLTYEAYFVYFGSVGYLDLVHSSQPPLSAYTLVNALSIIFRATLALVYSLGQAQ